MTAAGMEPGVISSAPKVFSEKTARKFVPRVKTDITATPSMASALTATPAGLGTGKKQTGFETFKVYQ